MKSWLPVLIALALVPFAAVAKDVPPMPPRPAPVSAAAVLGEEQQRLRGEAVVEYWDKCSYGFGDLHAEYRLILRNADAKEVVRQMELRMLEQLDYDPQGIKSTGNLSIIAFNQPPDVAGTAVLIHANLDRNDDTWVLLPSLKRVKRISSENQSGNFAGTEFSYEDIASQEFRKFGYRWLRDEACGTEAEPATCSVVEQVPAYRNSGYSKQIAWYDGCFQNRIDYFDRKGDLVKRQTFKDYRKYLDHQWRSHDNLMENLQTGKSTRLLIDRFTFGSGYSKDVFRPESLNSLIR